MNMLSRKEKKITKDGSPVAVFVIPTNEELMIAYDTMEIVKSSSTEKITD